MNVHFYKYQGAGNDFVLLDNRNNEFDHLDAKHIKHLCNRNFGIGADGLMLLNEEEGYDFKMVYYNADGNPSSMCGNGGRCIVKFAHDRGINANQYQFLAVDGPHLASFDEQQQVRLKMIDVEEITPYGADYIVNTGSPHYVKMVKDVVLLDVYTGGKDIRYSTDFSAEGINVNFVEQQPGAILVRTYERGVEDETLSCGTGVTASALVSTPHAQGFNRVEVTTRGGHLAVEFNKTGNNRYEDIWLCGPATFVFEGHIELP